MKKRELKQRIAELEAENALLKDQLNRANEFCGLLTPQEQWANPMNVPYQYPALIAAGWCNYATHR